jgi:xanthine dehydrogenase accessory factor
MLIMPDFKIVGTIGGGEMERRVIALSTEILALGQPRITQYDLVDPSQGDPGVCGGQVEIFMEPVLPEPEVLVIGCGHVGQAVVDLAHWLGFYVIACDDREDLCNPTATPHADQYAIVPPAKIAVDIPIHSRTYIAAVTRGMPLDVELLPDLLDTPAPYIGVIGSRRRWATAVKRLKERGVSKTKLAKVHAPIGLELQAETPREIAVSIMAEIISRIRGGSGEPMKASLPERITKSAS